MIYLFLLISLMAVSAGAQEGVPQWKAEAQQVISSAKIANQDTAMEAFQRGNGKGRFIVHLRARPVAANEPLHSEERKRERRMEVNSVRERAFSQMPAFPRNAARRFYDNFFAFSAEVTPEELQLLINNPDVRSIEPVYLLYPDLAQGIPLMRGDVYRTQYNGQGLSVAVCDTGIDYNNTYLGGGGFPNSKVIGGYDFGDNDTNPLDKQGHGTACAGIVAGALGTTADYIGGVAYNATLYALKISFGDKGNSNNEIIADAWDWCVTHQNDNPGYPIMIITTSFGGGKYTSTSNCDSDPDNESMRNAAMNAKAAGITVFASSGNYGYCDSIGSPACISHVISVGAVYDAAYGSETLCVNTLSCHPNKVIATSGPCFTTSGYGAQVTETTSADKVTAYSNSASFLNLLAPADNAYTLGLGTSGVNSSFGGTSAACPYAAGAAAALQSAAKALTGSWLTPDQVKSYLTRTGNLITDSKNGISKPRVNLAAAIKSLTANQKPNLAPIIGLLLSDNGTLPPPPPPTNTIPNGDFELAHTAWTEYNQSGYDIITNEFPVGLTAHSGSWAAWHGGVDNNTDYISQSVTVPASSPYLTWYQWIASEDSCGYDHGYVRINGVNTTTLDLCSSSNTNGWVPRSINLSSYAGQTVSLQFRSVTDATGNSNWFIDDVSFRSSALTASGLSTFIRSSIGVSSDTTKPKEK
jgi:subtilisin family serine protease